MKTTSEIAAFPVHAAGRTWAVDAGRVTTLRDGTLALSFDELERIHRAVANAICGAAEILRAEELEFLCDITDTSYADVARVLDIDKSTVTLRRRKGRVSKRPFSMALKRWFWFRIFGDEMGETTLSLASIASDELMLRRMQKAAIDGAMTFDVREKRAS